jgi:D-xylose transport system ATP-binding protein
VFAIADRITVLRDGAAQGTLQTAQTHAGAVIERMVGRPIHDLYPRRQPVRGDVVLAVEDLHAARSHAEPAWLRNLSFQVHAGEVLGIGGLMGAGRSELLLHLMGLWGERRRGTVRVRGQFLPADARQAAARAGLAIVTEDRKRLGLVPEAGVAFNQTLSSLRAIVERGLVNSASEARVAGAMAVELRVKAATLETPVRTLSGGNQQKVVIGKALLTKPGVLLLDEPTRGIDVGAKLEVYELINRLTEQGQAIVLVSSELPELMGMSDRILMLHEGHIGGEFTRETATPPLLLAAAMGMTAGRAA